VTELERVFTFSLTKYPSLIFAFLVVDGFIRQQWTTATIDDVVTTTCHFGKGNKWSSENKSTVIKEQQSNKMTLPKTTQKCKNLTLTGFTNQTKDQSTSSDRNGNDFSIE